MLNSVRNTVLAILNKNNYGYVSPNDFSLYAKQAQLEVFEQLFFNYNDLINKQNMRTVGTEYADLLKSIEEEIDVFSVNNFAITHVADNNFSVPSDYFLLNKFVVAGTRKELE